MWITWWKTGGFLWKPGGNCIETGVFWCCLPPVSTPFGRGLLHFSRTLERVWSGFYGGRRHRETGAESPRLPSPDLTAARILRTAWSHGPHEHLFYSHRHRRASNNVLLRPLQSPAYHTGQGSFGPRGPHCRVPSPSMRTTSVVLTSALVWGPNARLRRRFAALTRRGPREAVQGAADPRPERRREDAQV